MTRTEWIVALSLFVAVESAIVIIGGKVILAWLFG